MNILRSLNRCCALLAFGFLLALCALPAHADTPIALYAFYDGRMNFTGTQVTWRAYSNTQGACTVYTPTSTRTASFSLPLGATIVAAHLYWAGSGTADYNVVLQGTAVTATRRHTSTTVGGGLNYFGAAADVTSIVKARGAGTYSFSGLTVANGNPWCDSQAVLGGFSLLVVYSHPLEPERVLNVYEGFRYVQNSTVNVQASNFRWAKPAIAVKEKARVGHITWEGDTTLSGGGERLMFEGTELTDTMNPAGNQFNSRSNINNDNNSFGLDFDAYDTTVTIWSGYDAVVDTSYQTGQDLVLLGAEVLVVPTLPVSDMSVALTGPAELQVTVPATYKMVLTNNGPYTAPGPLTATLTLPPGVSYASATGSNWNCSAAAATSTGQTVTCTYTGAVAPETSSTEVVVTTSVTSTGEKVSKAVVSGADDDKPANNTATHTATAKAAPPPPSVPASSYVFTKGVCPIGSLVGPASDTGPCSAFAGPRIAGDTQPIYMTALDANKRAVALSKTAATPVPMKFSLGCVDPAPSSSAIAGSYAGTTLPPCSSTPTWSSEVPVNFPANTASVVADFKYDDVGSVALSLMQGTNTASTSFISRPWKLAFRSIRRESDGVEDPVAHAPADPAFAMAGEPLRIEVGALLFNSTRFAPSFGNERRNPDGSGAFELTLANNALNTDSSKPDWQPDPGKVMELGETTWAGGVGTMSQTWTEVGITEFVLRAPAYLGVSGVLPSDPRVVGRFYPAYYNTNLFGPFPCPLDDGNTSTEKKCLNDTEVDAPMPAVYSGQQFDGLVLPFSAQDTPIRNFGGAWYKALTLTAASGSGGVLLPKNFTSAAWPVPVDDPETPEKEFVLRGPLVYAVQNPYLTASPRAGNWTAPSLVFLRAESSDTRLSASGIGQPALIKSMRAPDPVNEGGINVLNGRLKVPNALGTDILPTPLAVRVEYWDGATWRPHAGFTEDPDYAAGDVTSAAATFSNCSYGFANTAPRPNNCLDVAAGDAKKVTLTAGRGTVWLRRPGKLPNGRSRDGAVDVQFPYRSWLPSTVGRVTFGRYRSSVIYVREVY